MKQKKPISLDSPELFNHPQKAELCEINNQLAALRESIACSFLSDDELLADALDGIYSVLVSREAILLLQVAHASSRRVAPATRRITERLTLSLYDRWFCARDLPGVEAGQHVSLFEISGDVYALLPDTPELHKLEQV